MKSIKILILALACGALCSCSPKPKAEYEYPFRNPYLPVDERVDNLLSMLTLEEKVSMMINRSLEIERLGIPAYNWWGGPVTVLWALTMSPFSHSVSALPPHSMTMHS